MAAETSKFRRKLDRFWSVLFLTPEGRPKSAVLLYSFCLSLLYVIIYGICYFFLIDVIENAFVSASAVMRNVFESVVPGVTGSIICCPLWFIVKDKRIVPAAFVWMCAYAVAALISMAFLCEGTEYSIFLYFFAMIVPVGLITGTAFTHHMYRRNMKLAAVKEDSNTDA